MSKVSPGTSLVWQYNKVSHPIVTHPHPPSSSSWLTIFPHNTRLWVCTSVRLWPDSRRGDKHSKQNTISHLSNHSVHAFVFRIFSFLLCESQVLIQSDFVWLSYLPNNYFLEDSPFQNKWLLKITIPSAYWEMTRNKFAKYVSYGIFTF